MKSYWVEELSSFWPAKEAEEMVTRITEIVNTIFRKQKWGRPRENMKKVIGGLLWYLKRGISWRSIPRVFGKWQKIYWWHRRFAATKLWTWLHECVLNNAIELGAIKLNDLCGDCTLVSAPRGGDGTAKVKKFKGKVHSKIAVTATTTGILLEAQIGDPNKHDSQYFPKMFYALQKLNLPEKYKMRMDKGFDACWIRLAISKHKLGQAYIPTRRRKGEVALAGTKDHLRWRIERSISHLKNYKSIAIRRQRLDFCYQATVDLALLIDLVRKIKNKFFKTAIWSVI